MERKALSYGQNAYLRITKVSQGILVVIPVVNPVEVSAKTAIQHQKSTHESNSSFGDRVENDAVSTHNPRRSF